MLVQLIDFITLFYTNLYLSTALKTSRDGASHCYGYNTFID